MGTRVRVSLGVIISDRVRASFRVRIRVIAQSQVRNTSGTTARGWVRVRGRGRVRARLEVSIRRS